eukprot:2083591-Prymnesium_polylepis.1
MTKRGAVARRESTVRGFRGPFPGRPSKFHVAPPRDRPGAGRAAASEQLLTPFFQRPSTQNHKWLPM